MHRRNNKMGAKMSESGRNPFLIVMYETPFKTE